jgi:molecular chaperone GrpE
VAEKDDNKSPRVESVPSGVPQSAFEEALKAIENIQKSGAAKAKQKKAERRDKEIEIDIDTDSESLSEFLKHLDEDEPSRKAPRQSAPPPAPDPQNDDLDVLAKLLEEEQGLEKEAEFLKSVLLETQSATSAPSDPRAIKEKEDQVQQLQDRLLRIQAEFDNFKKRINRDKADMVRFSNENLILSILPIIDNFERAISHAAATSDPLATIDGVRLILKQLHDTLAANGVRKIDATDQVFDPTYHEAMATIASNVLEPGRVITQYESGYLLHGRLLRPAKVIVSTKIASEGEENTNGGGVAASAGEMNKANQ